MSRFSVLVIAWLLLSSLVLAGCGSGGGGGDSGPSGGGSPGNGGGGSGGGGSVTTASATYAYMQSPIADGSVTIRNTVAGADSIDLDYDLQALDSASGMHHMPDFYVKFWIYENGSTTTTSTKILVMHYTAFVANGPFGTWHYQVKSSDQNTSLGRLLSPNHTVVMTYVGPVTPDGNIYDLISIFSIDPLTPQWLADWVFGSG